MKHHVIYVPGLGDKHSYGQPYLLRFWRLYGVISHYHAVRWADKEPFEPKLERLLKLIDALKTDDNKVSLVGISAGASAVLTAYSMRTDKITAVVCISGKINNGDSIGNKIYEINPAFKDSMARIPCVLTNLGKSERQKIMSVHPIKDNTVPIEDTIIPGAFEQQIHISGHIKSVFYCLTIYSRNIVRFLKSL